MTVLFARGVPSLVEGAWWIGCIFVLSWMIFGVEPSISSWLAIIVGILSTMIALISVGVFFASFFVLTRAADQMASALQAPIRFFSGVAFPVSALPQLLQFVAYILPLTYGRTQSGTMAGLHLLLWSSVSSSDSSVLGTSDRLPDTFDLRGRRNEKSTHPWLGIHGFRHDVGSADADSGDCDSDAVGIDHIRST